jgi:hypothetical protein
MGMDTRTRPRLVAVCCAAALLLPAGCGGDAEPAAGGGPDGVEAPVPADAGVPPDAPAVEPCSLVDDAEMAALLTEQLPADEGEVTVTSESTSLGPDTCQYSWGRSTWSAGSEKEFQVSLLPPDDLTFTAAIGERTPIPGVGDEAFEVSDNYFARVGDTVVHVVNLQETPEASVAVLTAAAGAL